MCKAVICFRYYTVYTWHNTYFSVYCACFHWYILMSKWYIWLHPVGMPIIFLKQTCAFRNDDSIHHYQTEFSKNNDFLLRVANFNEPLSMSTKVWRSHYSNFYKIFLGLYLFNWTLQTCVGVLRNIWGMEKMTLGSVHKALAHG